MSEKSAVIQTGGKQYRVREGDVIEIELVGKGAGEEVSFDQVLLVTSDGDIKVGTPVVKGAKVVGKVVMEKKGPKVIAFKYTRRANYRRKVGHRQNYSVVKIESVIIS